MNSSSTRRHRRGRFLTFLATWRIWLVVPGLVSAALAPSSFSLEPGARSSAAAFSEQEVQVSTATAPSTLALQQPPRVGIVVMDVTGSVKLQIQQHHLFALASVAKLYIMVAFLDEVAEENRNLTNEESLLLEQMITVSDNYAASDLWRRIGGYDGLSDYLDEADLPPVERAYDNSWGSMRVTAANLAELLAALYQRELLPNRLTLVALDLMQEVSDDQAWGLGSARHPDGIRVPAVYFKNGWYPEDDGWIANSVGIIADGTGTHVMILLTDQQASLEDSQRFLNAATFLLRVHLGAVPLVSPAMGASR